MKEKQYVGIEVGHDCIKIAMLKKHKKRVSVEQEEVINMSGGIIENGIIVDVGKLHEQIDERLKKSFLKAQGAYVVIKSTLPITTEVSLPNKHVKNQEKEILEVLQERLSMDCNQYSFHTKIISDPATTEMTANVLAFPKSGILRTEYFTKKLGIRCKKITLFSEVIINMIAKTYGDTMEKPTAILVIEAQDTYISMIQNGITRMNKRITYPIIDGSLVKKITMELEKMNAFYQYDGGKQGFKKLYIRSDYEKNWILEELSKSCHFEIINMLGCENKTCDYMAYTDTTPLDLIKHDNGFWKDKILKNKIIFLATLECALVLGIIINNFYEVLTKEALYEKTLALSEKQPYAVAKQLNEEVGRQEKLLKTWDEVLEQLQTETSVADTMVGSMIKNMPKDTEIDCYSFETNRACLQGLTANIDLLEEMLKNFKGGYSNLQTNLAVDSVHGNVDKIPFLLTMQFDKEVEREIEDE
ncbi:MAG: hypothetical protein AB9856_18945 [Cellulosilyticaceae bacterium]